MTSDSETVAIWHVLDGECYHANIAPCIADPLLFEKVTSIDLRINDLLYVIPDRERVEIFIVRVIWSSQ
jgi:hypothetical protein